MQGGDVTKLINPQRMRERGWVCPHKISFYVCSHQLVMVPTVCVLVIDGFCDNAKGFARMCLMILATIYYSIIYERLTKISVSKLALTLLFVTPLETC